MKKILLSLALLAGMSLAAQAQYQIGNSDFETDWADNNEPGSGWYSFSSATGDYSSYKSLSKSTTTKLTDNDAHGGQGTSVRLKSISLFIANANGNLTTGMINMGHTTPSNQANYNYTKRGSANSCKFSGHPDAFEYWAKFKRGGSGTYKGRCHVIIHGDYDYRDPYETEANKTKYKIAETIVYAEPCTEWTKFSGELVYTNVESDPDKRYVLATFTTNETPGGSSGDVFDIDDIKFVYYSQLKSITIDGESVPGFDKDVYNYTLDRYYEEGLTQIELKDNTMAGVAEIQSSYDRENAIYTVTVKGENFSEDPTNHHTYTFQFIKPILLGDVNGDKAITIADVTALVNIILGKDTENQYDHEAADVNSDGSVTIADVTALVNIILGKSN